MFQVTNIDKYKVRSIMVTLLVRNYWNRYVPSILTYSIIVTVNGCERCRAVVLNDWLQSKALSNYIGSCLSKVATLTILHSLIFSLEYLLPYDIKPKIKLTLHLLWSHTANHWKLQTAFRCLNYVKQNVYLAWSSWKEMR